MQSCFRKKLKEGSTLFRLFFLTTFAYSEDGFGKMRINWNRKRIVAVCAALLIGGAAGLYLRPHSKVAVSLQKQAAKIRKVEYIPQQDVRVENTLAFARKDSLYKDFRQKFRFHYQGIGCASFADSSRMLLISEPSPFLVADSLPRLFEPFRIQVERRQHRIGYDGHITDLVVILGNATSENVEHLVRKLSKALYFSDYKTPVFALPSEEKRVYFSSGKLDYRISLGEINTWFLETPELFLKLEDTAHTYSVQELLSEKKYGVYFSQLPGFVAWVLPKHRDLTAYRSDIRPFTLDADLILAAISDSASLVIIGRERESALNELPPLQVETILLLASINDRELSQSLDINDLMAGKMGDGRDWCPTYLSRKLENTEFGDLLTLTDILLKDWSESGTIREAYYRYPHPGYYPFPQPLFDLLGVNELVYNWNTTDVMYAIDTEGKTLYSLNRTGSLPVSYFLSQERSTSAGRNYEQKAYAYFARSGNTDLARVVQYTALYQLFIDNDIRYSGDLHNCPPKNKPYLLTDAVRKLLGQIGSLSADEIQHLTDTVTRIQFEGFHRERINRQIADAENRYGFQYKEEEKEQIRQRIREDQKEQLIQQFTEVRQLLSSLSEESRTRLCRYLAYPRATLVLDAETYRTYRQAQQIKKLAHMLGKNHFVLIGTDLADVMSAYCRQLSGKCAPYLKTPSCVITYHDFFTTGGHNLSSKINRVHSMTSYQHRPVVEETESYPATQTDKVPNEPERPSAAPSRSAGAPGKTASSNRPVSTAKTTPAVTASRPQTTKPAVQSKGVRERSSVIPTQARPSRGL